MDTTELELAYLAGLMDGEGTWSISVRPNRSPNARMTMSLKNGHTKPLALLVKHFGGAVYHYDHGDGMYRWSLGGRQALLDATWSLQPYLLVKADVADRFLAALALWPDTKGLNRYRGERVWTPELIETVRVLAAQLNHSYGP